MIQNKPVEEVYPSQSLREKQEANHDRAQTD
jgi:hypothetical protein